jgi:site-specific DNA-cytosine methylase
MNRIKVLSLFSGAGGLDLGLERAGMEVVALCEIDPKAKMVLRKHWPDTFIYDDVREVTRERLISDNIIRPDIVAGGSPCQDLSVAGRRKGLDGSRSGLFWEQCRIADEIGADILWENVPGALSSNDGADFAAVLWGITGALVELPPKQKWAKSGVLVGPKRTAIWRVADAQRFGVPQRRRRIYVIGCSGTMARGLAPLLLECEGGQGNHSSGRETRTRSSGTASDGSGDSGGHRAGRPGGDAGNDGNEVTGFVKSRRAQSNTDDETWKEGGVAPTLTSFDNGGDSRATVLAIHDETTWYTESQFAQYAKDIVGTLRAAGGTYGGGSENIVVTKPEVAACLRSGGDGGVPSSRGENLVVQHQYDPRVIGFSHTQGLDHQASTTVFPTLRAEGGGHAVMYDPTKPASLQDQEDDGVVD